MAGRDPHEEHRVATPLELLFDLTFVVAFGVAADGLAHALTAGHPVSGMVAFAFAVFAICVAWINFTWFASAYDTDDWAYRLATMVQMVGVLVFALGLPAFFDSVEAGGRVDSAVLVAGYIVMRVALVAQWLRAARQDPDRRPVALAYAVVVAVAQLFWVGTVFLPTAAPVTLLIWLVLGAVELGGPRVAETRATGTPWHAHHVAERYGLLAIIALGEGVVGTVASISAVVAEQGWSLDAAVLATAGTGLTFGMWWMYFMIPTADGLHLRRDRAWFFGYLHIVLFGAIVAVGAGLHVAAYYVEHHSDLGTAATLAAVAAPVAVYTLLLYVVYWLLLGGPDRLHVLLLVATAAVLANAVPRRKPARAAWTRNADEG